MDDAGGSYGGCHHSIRVEGEEMKRLWSILCEGYIRKFCLLYLLLFLVEVITVFVTKQSLDLCAGIVYLWIFPGFFAMMHLHRKRIKEIKVHGVASRILLLPLKQSTLYFSEFLFVFSTVVLLVVVQYLVWPIAFWIHQSRLLDIDHQFFFYTAASYMMRILAPFGWRMLVVVIVLVLLSLVLTLIISDSLLGRTRVAKPASKETSMEKAGNQTLLFILGAILLFVGGMGGYLGLYHFTKFPIHTMSGDASLLETISLELSYLDVMQIDVRLEGNDTTITRKDFDWRWDKEGFFQSRIYGYEQENGEWMEEKSEDGTCVYQIQELEKAILGYEFYFIDDTLHPEESVYTKVYEPSKEDAVFQLRKSVCQEKENLTVEKKNQQDEDIQVEELTPLERMKRYDQNTYYFVPNMKEHSFGDAYLYRLIKKDAAFDVNQIAKLDETMRSQGCLIVSDQILVIAIDGQDSLLSLYNKEGSLIKTQTIDAEWMPLDTTFYVSEHAVLWQNGEMVWILDTDTMMLKQEQLEDEPIIRLAYKNGILWVVGLDQKEGSYQHITIKAQKENEVLYEGMIHHIYSGWQKDVSVDVDLLDCTIE